MLSFQDLSFSQTLPSAIFDQLGELLQQMAQGLGNTAMVMTEATLARSLLYKTQNIENFTLIVSQGFSALMLGTYDLEEETGNGNTEIIEFELINKNGNGINGSNSFFKPQRSLIHTQITFSPTEISYFVRKLQNCLNPSSQIFEKLNISLQKISLNDPTLQTKFTILLLNLLLSPNNKVSDFTSVYPSVSVCKTVENALKKQIAQEKLLNDVTTKIRKSLDLPVIMTTVVEQVREFLELDRLVIYKFEDSASKNQPQQLNIETNGQVISFPIASKLENHAKAHTNGWRQPRRKEEIILNHSGANGFDINGKIDRQKLETITLKNWQEYTSCIIYEAKKSEHIPSVLNYQEVNCFKRNSQCWEKYNQGFTLAVDDIEVVYAADLCLLEFLRSAHIRSKLAAPIIYEDKLWGLLIAHNCDGIRHWQETEKNFLSQIAEQLAIAIHQAELMRSLTQEKENLEERVIERTIALHDALVAAEAASRIRSEFIATISHELLTPLTHIIGMSSTLLRTPFGRLTKRQRDYLEKIHHSGDRLQEMIYDILDISQIEAGKVALNITDFSLVKATQEVIKSLREKANHKRINLQIEEIIPQNYIFTADEKRVKQIFWNILSNAIKFTPDAGNITVRLWVEDDQAILQVEDTGIGIPQHQQPLLFEKFQQLHNPYRRTYEGTGLGLALTKQLIDLHRGRIEVDSTENVGSIFTVWIPHLRK